MSLPFYLRIQRRIKPLLAANLKRADMEVICSQQKAAVFVMSVKI